MPVSLRSTAQAASGLTGFYTCDAPLGVTAGDVLVAFQTSDTGALSDMGTPTGGTTWQLLASRAGDGGSWPGTKVWWKVAGTEPSTYSFTQHGSADGVVAIAAISGAGTTAPLTAQTGTGSGGTSVTTPSITPAGAADVELRWACGTITATSVIWSPPATYTERADVQSRTYATGSLASKQLASASPTGAQIFTTSASLSKAQGFTVTISDPTLHATVAPANVAATTAIPAPSPSTGSKATPSPVAATTAIPAPSPSGGATITPATVAATTAVPQPVLATGGNITTGAAPIAATTTIPAPGVSTGSKATPATVAAVATVPAVHIQLPEHATAAPATVAVTAAIPLPQVVTPILPGALITRPGQIEYAGFLLGAGTPYRMTGLTGIDDLPDAESGNVARPAMHGSWPGTTLARDRTITFTGFISVAAGDFEAVRNALVAATPYPEGADDLPLAIRVLSTTHLVYGKIAPGGRIIGMERYRIGHAPIVLQWICADPIMYGIAVRTADLPRGGTIQVLNAGNTPTRPTLRIAGPAVNPELRVVDTGRTMRFGINLAAGEYLDVDCRAGSALWMGTTNVLAALSSASVPPVLFEFPPGISQVSYTATGTSVPVANVLHRDATL